MDIESIEYIERLAKLRDANNITDTEYETMKAELLGRAEITLDPEPVDTTPPQTVTTLHGQKFCPFKSRPIPKRNRIYSAPCPHCGVALPAKNKAVNAQYNGSGTARTTPSTAPQPKTRKRNKAITLAVIGVFVLSMVSFGVLAASIEVPPSEASSVSEVTTTTKATTSTKPRNAIQDTPRDVALRATNYLWIKYTGNYGRELAPGHAERIGGWADGLAGYLTYGDAQCSGMIDQVSQWTALTGLEGNDQMITILDKWSPVVEVDIQAAWDSC